MLNFFPGFLLVHCVLRTENSVANLENIEPTNQQPSELNTKHGKLDAIPMIVEWGLPPHPSSLG